MHFSALIYIVTGLVTCFVTGLVTGLVNSLMRIKFSARFWLIFNLELRAKRPRAEPSRAENPSARAAWLGIITNNKITTT